MNDAWNPVEDLEPLDDSSLGLLAAYHDATGPSADAEARMLAGLRARLATEGDAHTPAAAVPPEPARIPRGQGASTNARTFTIAAVAFAAGVALTVALSRPNAQQVPEATSNLDAEHITRRDAAGLSEQLRPGSFVPQGGTAPSELSEPRGVESLPQPSWPMSIADMVTPRSIVEIEPAERSIPRIAETARTEESDDGTSAPMPRRPPGDEPRDPREGGSASRSPLRGPSDPAALGTGGAIRGPWAPSVSGAPAGASIGSAARNPAVGGPAPASPSAGSGASNAGGDGTSETPPEEPPSPEPEPENEPESEPENEPEDERPPEDVCFEELDACLADANIFCDYGYPGCDSAYHFCEMRSALCLDGDDALPDPGYPHDEPDPDGPDPDDCDTEYELCVLEVDMVCIPGHLPPEECENMMFQCDEAQMMCYGEPPPEPW